MLRYLRRLEAKDLSLCHSMIPLGSCTMKLNATSEMLPVSWPEFAKLHPFAPQSQATGYHALFHDLEAWLAEITGFAAVSLQPNAGSKANTPGSSPSGPGTRAAATRTEMSASSHLRPRHQPRQRCHGRLPRRGGGLRRPGQH